MKKLLFGTALLFVTVFCACTPYGDKEEVTIDLDIHNGQGGPERPEADEETVGAFTVANLNDTDGDGIVDKDDNDVIATANGRDELDLMQIILRKPVPDLGDKVMLKVVSGDVKFWEKSTKETEVTAREFATADLPKNLWVEARAISGGVRDIVIEMEYKGFKDTVKATGIWAEKTKFRNGTEDRTNLSADADGADIRNTFRVSGGQLGATHVSPRTNNGMEMEFTVKPEGIGDEPGIVFDITRKSEGKIWNVDAGVTTEIASRTFPSQDEEPNDDGGNTDEDNVPKNNHIYVIDLPGRQNDVAFVDRFVFRANFNEFVRVLVNGGTFTNDNGLIEGSRASAKIPWRSRIDVVEDVATGKWTRNAIAGENEIVENNKAIGAPP